MTVETAAIGKRFAPLTYAVGREKIIEYARATGETNPVHLDLAAARAAGHADVVAPPMFAVVYQARSVAEAMFDPELKPWDSAALFPIIEEAGGVDDPLMDEPAREAGAHSSSTCQRPRTAPECTDAITTSPEKVE